MPKDYYAGPGGELAEEIQHVRRLFLCEIHLLTSSPFYSCAEYFNGRTSLEEMQYKTGLDRRDIRQVLALFKEEV